MNQGKQLSDYVTQVNSPICFLIPVPVAKGPLKQGICSQVPLPAISSDVWPYNILSWEAGLIQHNPSKRDGPVSRISYVTQLLKEKWKGPT